MHSAMPMRRQTGKIATVRVAGEGYQAFIPLPLPPTEPPLELGADLSRRLAAAVAALDRLELASAMVPSLDWFLYGFVRKEAVLSSQIEGTEATLVDLFELESFETGEAQPDLDLEEVCNYHEGLQYARGQLVAGTGLPVSMRLLNEVHARLMRGVRGADKQPGEVRRSQNWIGGTRPGNAFFVPPPPEELPQLLSDFERFLHAKDDLHPLLRVGLLHVQFETIHPYLDGNGRIGRLLVTLLLEHFGLLSQPLCYLSLYFKQRRTEYYDRLTAVRIQGDWEGWLRFFFDGVEATAVESADTACELFALITRDRQTVLAARRSSLAAMRIFELLPMHPVVTVAWCMRATGTTRPTATKAIATLIECGILRETSGKKRDQTFGYWAYLEHLRQGTDLP